MLVWRITEGSTKGEWVDPAAIPVTLPQARAPRVPSESWASSSFDLFNGCDVSESPDTVPGELLDELFQAPDAAPKKS
jgi:hypothetical protein